MTTDRESLDWEVRRSRREKLYQEYQYGTGEITLVGGLVFAVGVFLLALTGFILLDRFVVW